jgi:hypothetical protein
MHGNVRISCEDKKSFFFCGLAFQSREAKYRLMDDSSTHANTQTLLIWPPFSQKIWLGFLFHLLKRLFGLMPLQQLCATNREGIAQLMPEGLVSADSRAPLSSTIFTTPSSSAVSPALH